MMSFFTWEDGSTVLHLCMHVPAWEGGRKSMQKSGNERKRNMTVAALGENTSVRISLCSDLKRVRVVVLTSQLRRKHVTFFTS